MWDRLFPVNGPPIAHVDATHAEGLAPLTVVISAADSSDPDGDTLKYRWWIDAEEHRTTEMTFGHVFTEPKSYIVSLWVEDSAGQTNTTKHTIAVREKQDLSVVTDVIDRAERSIQVGNFRTPLDELNQWRYSCVERSIPPELCAQLHEQAGEAEARIDPMDSALESMREAVDLMPEDQLHVAHLAAVHILRNEPVDAINVLSDFGANNPLGAPASLAMGIAQAMNGDYAMADAHLRAVAVGDTMSRAAARYAQLVVDALAAQTGTPFTEEDLIPPVCDDPSIRYIFHPSRPWVERHIRIVRVLVDRLGDDGRKQLQQKTRLIEC